MIDIVIGYFLVSGVLFIRSVLLIEETILTLKKTRSRELKVTKKQWLDVQKSNILLCLVWPYTLLRAGKTIFLYYKEKS